MNILWQIWAILIQQSQNSMKIKNAMTQKPQDHLRAKARLHFFCVAMATAYNFLICCASVRFLVSGRNTTENDPLHNPRVPTYQLASFLSLPVLWQSPLSDTNGSLFNNIATDCHKPSLPRQLMTRIREMELTARQCTACSKQPKNTTVYSV